MPSRKNPLNTPGGQQFAEEIFEKWTKVLIRRRPESVERNGKHYEIVPEIVIDQYPLTESARQWLEEAVYNHAEEHNQRIIQRVQEQFERNGFILGPIEQVNILAAGGHDVILTNVNVVLPTGAAFLVINPHAKNISYVNTQWLQPDHISTLTSNAAEEVIDGKPSDQEVDRGAGDGQVAHAPG